jgi:transposase
VVDAVWSPIERLIPAVPEVHPLGCHRPRVADRVCFEVILVILVTGCSWVDVEYLLGDRVSDTTLRARRDEWIAAGVFDRLADDAIASYDRIIGLDFSDCSIDGSQHKAPAGGEGTGPSPVDRGKRGWKWSLFADRHGIPIGWTTDGDNRNDCTLVAPTLAATAQRVALGECQTLHLDRGYDNGIVRRLGADSGIDYTRIYRGRGELIDHVFASHRLVNPDNIPAVGIVAASPLPSMTDDPTPQTSAPSDHAAVVATFSL